MYFLSLNCKCDTWQIYPQVVAYPLLKHILIVSGHLYQKILCCHFTTTQRSTVIPEPDDFISANDAGVTGALVASTVTQNTLHSTCNNMETVTLTGAQEQCIYRETDLWDNHFWMSMDWDTKNRACGKYG